MIGLGKHYEVCTCFIVKENVDYDCLIGTTTIRRINGVVNFPKNQFEYQLPRSGAWRALPLLGNSGRGPRAHVTMINAKKRL
jgi:hypothetical protein